MLNKKDMLLLKKLKGELSEFEKSAPIPEALKKENIVTGLNNVQQIKAKKKKNVQLWQLAAAAAIVAFAVGITALLSQNLPGFVPNTTKPPSGIVVQTQGENTQSETTQNNVSESTTQNKNGVSPASLIKPAASYTRLKNAVSKAIDTQSWFDQFRGGSGTPPSGVETPNGENGDGNSPGTGVGDGGDFSSYDSVSHGKTNVQVEGVEEADFLKTDGRYLYTVSNYNLSDSYVNEISIVDAKDPKNLKVVSTIKANTKQDDKKTFEKVVCGLYIYDNKLIVISREFSAVNSNVALMETIYYVNDSYFANTKTVTTVYDISDKSKPTKISTVAQDGCYVSSRMIGSRLYLVTDYNLNFKAYPFEIKGDNYIPTITQNGKITKIAAENIFVPDSYTEFYNELSYVVLSSVDIKNPKGNVDSVAVLGGGGDVYCSGTNLYAVRSYASYPADFDPSKDFNISDKTEIYKFSLGSKISYLCSGKVDGRVLNQFSIDESNEFLRIATTNTVIKQIKYEYSSSITSGVYVLDKSLTLSGKVSGLAPEEMIKSARFIGTKAYVVTYKDVDPLFVIDLANVKSPKVLGELKIPGFSQYLHPVSETLLAGIGVQDGSVKISLFDVSNPKNPIEKDVYIIEGDSESKAYDHRSVLLIPERNMIAFPVTQYVFEEPFKFSVGMYGFTIKNSKIVAVKPYMKEMTENPGSEVYSQYHSDYEDIERGTYIGNVLYAVSGSRIFAYSLDTGNRISTLTFRTH